MFALILVIIQFLILTFIGGFARTTLAFTTSSYFVGTNMLFLLTWTLMNAPFKKLTLHALTILLLAFAFTFQCNLLFGRFWYSVFNQFTTTYELTLEIAIESSVACFVVLLVMIDYIGIFRYWQIYMLLVPIINFGWSFNYAVLRYGLKIFDGGMANGFLYAGVASIVIWIFSVRSKHDKFGGYDTSTNNLMKPQVYIREEYYNGYTISLFGGLIGTFFLWPSVNASTSLMSGSLAIVNSAIKNSSLFQNSAYSNTFLCLCVGTVSSFILLNRDRIGQKKHKIRCTIDCFINAGIICAYFVDITLNPAAVMAMSLVSTLLTLVLYLYYQSLQSDSNKLQPLSNFMILLMYYARALFRIVLPLLGSIVAAIVVATRQYSTAQLLDTPTYGLTIYGKTAGLQVASYFVTLGISIVGGVLCGVGVNLFLYIKENYPGKVDEKEKVEVESRLGQKPRQSKLSLDNSNNKERLGFTAQKLPPANKSQLVRSRNIYKSKYLTDVDFLELDQNGGDMFPLFLKPQDKYVDQEETARKMLKQAILSHVKNNYISTNNYISITKNNNVNTNNTATGDAQFETRPNPRRKLEFNLDGDQVLKSSITKQPTRRQYSNNMEQYSPKSARSKIKNQAKEIQDLNKKSSRFQKTQQARQAMPEFYVDHMRGNRQRSLKKAKDDSMNSRLSQPPVNELNRSQTQKYLTYEPNNSRVSVKNSNASNKNVSSSGLYVISRISRKETLNPPIKKTESLRQIPKMEASKKDKNASNFSIISELEKEQEEQKGKQIVKRMSTQNRDTLERKAQNALKEEQGIDESGSFVMEENQHEPQDSQYI